VLDLFQPEPSRWKSVQVRRRRHRREWWHVCNFQRL